MSALNILKTFIIFSFLIFTLGCASLQQNNNVLAVIDGEPILKDDLLYGFSQIHRLQDASTATSLNISRYLENLIDDMLIVQEARRMGLEDDPEFQKAANSFIMSESVNRLFAEQIKQKVTVSEKEILDYYNRNFQQFLVEMIGVSTRDTADEIMAKIKSNGDFSELAHTYSAYQTGNENNTVSLMFNSQSPYVQKILTALRPGEVSNIFETDGTFYIIKLIKSHEPPADRLENYRKRIQKTLLNQKTEVFSVKYLEHLREQADIRIDEQLLSEVTTDKNIDDTKKWTGDKRPLVRLNGSLFTIDEFISAAPDADLETGKTVINSWIERKLVDNEALRRNYAAEPDLARKVTLYKGQLLKKLFIHNAIYSHIDKSDRTLEEYYMKNKNKYLAPDRFRIHQITVKTMDEAGQILESLKKDSNFSWLARNKSTDEFAQSGGDAGWFTKDQLPESAQKFIDNLKPDESSPIFKVEDLFRIIRLEEKIEGTVHDFSAVKDVVFKEYIEDQMKIDYNKSLSLLKGEARIKIYEDTVKSFEKEMMK